MMGLLEGAKEDEEIKKENCRFLWGLNKGLTLKSKD